MKNHHSLLFCYHLSYIPAGPSNSAAGRSFFSFCLALFLASITSCSTEDPLNQPSSGSSSDLHLLSPWISNINQIPGYLVSFSATTAGGKELRCTGSHLGSGYILTAAHCVTSHDPWDQGAQDLLPHQVNSLFYMRSKPTLVRRLSELTPGTGSSFEIFTHPLYTGLQKPEYNLALIKISPSPGNIKASAQVYGGKAHESDVLALLDHSLPQQLTVHGLGTPNLAPQRYRDYSLNFTSQGAPEFFFSSGTADLLPSDTHNSFNPLARLKSWAAKLITKSEQQGNAAPPQELTFSMTANSLYSNGVQLFCRGDEGGVTTVEIAPHYSYPSGDIILGVLSNTAEKLDSWYQPDESTSATECGTRAVFTYLHPHKAWIDQVMSETSSGGASLR